MSAKKTRENAGAAATEAPTKSYAKRDSATAVLRKMGVQRADYSKFIAAEGGQFTLDVEAARGFLTDAERGAKEDAARASAEAEPRPRPSTQIFVGSSSADVFCTACALGRKETVRMRELTDVEKRRSWPEGGLVGCVDCGASLSAAVGPQKAAADGAETAARKPRAAGEPTVSSVARELILEGLDNAAVFAELRKRFPSLGEDKKWYPGWYRGDMRRKGLLK